MKWCDILRVKAEFPVNLWPNAVQCYQRWIHDCVRDNMHYDQFARALLTSSGSGFRVGPVNFYRAVQGRKPSSIASVVMLTLMGTRLDKWPPEETKGMESFFSRINYKYTTEWKEEIVCNDPAALHDIDGALSGWKIGADSSRSRPARGFCRLADSRGQSMVHGGHLQSGLVVADGAGHCSRA